MPFWCADCGNYIHGGNIAEVSCSKLQPGPTPPPASYHSERPEQLGINKLDNDMDVSDEVFVIMAGEEKPSCLAKPVASITQPCEQV
ncbi:hypothetical protein REPUB_Repub07fG0040800 [Reevesia pubescens]